MTVQEMEIKKVKIISIIASLYDEELLRTLENVLISVQKDWWNVIDDKERKAIQEGMADYKKGKLVANDEVLEGAKKLIRG